MFNEQPPLADASTRDIAVLFHLNKDQAYMDFARSGASSCSAAHK